MLVQISGKGFELSSELRDHVEERVSTALDRFTDRIARVNVFLADENGPKNGLDKSLRLIIDIERLPLIVVEERGESWYAASTERQSEPFMLSAAKSTEFDPGPIEQAWRAMELVRLPTVWNILKFNADFHRAPEIRVQLKSLKAIFMKCPNCIAVDLLMSERKGIEIDYCPSCRGVWLDRGELDKFIQQADQQVQVEKAPSAERSRGDLAPQFERNDDDDRKYDDRRHENREFRDDEGQYHRNGKKKESFWSNIFDFD